MHRFRQFTRSLLDSGKLRIAKSELARSRSAISIRVRSDSATQFIRPDWLGARFIRRFGRRLSFDTLCSLSRGWRLALRSASVLIGPTPNAPSQMQYPRCIPEAYPHDPPTLPPRRPCRSPRPPPPSRRRTTPCRRTRPPSRMTLPDGFKATLFAGEPDVVQPIAFCFDDRGRLWVCECRSYPKWIKDGSPGEDRILIFEDTEEHRHLRQADRLRRQARQPLQHRVRLRRRLRHVCPEPAPHPDRPDDRSSPPARRPCSSTAGRSTRSTTSSTASSGAPTAGSTAVTASSPRRRSASPARPTTSGRKSTAASGDTIPCRRSSRSSPHGTTNPWGIDWDEHGELYLTNCVIEHAFHVIPGGHYKRMYGSDFDPNLYKLMGTLRRPPPLGRRRLDHLARRQGDPLRSPAAAMPTPAA